MYTLLTLGYMPMPDDFIYKDVLIKGKPYHDKYDPFRIRHPLMDTGRRAKIFAPFDALAGFSDAILSAERQSSCDALPSTEKQGFDEALPSAEKQGFCEALLSAEVPEISL